MPGAIQDSRLGSHSLQLAATGAQQVAELEPGTYLKEMGFSPIRTAHQPAHTLSRPNLDHFHRALFFSF